MCRHVQHLRRPVGQVEPKNNFHDIIAQEVQGPYNPLVGISSDPLGLLVLT